MVKKLSKEDEILDEEKMLIGLINSADPDERKNGELLWKRFLAKYPERQVCFESTTKLYYLYTLIMVVHF